MLSLVERYLQRIVDESVAARVVRKSMGKAAMLGILDAIKDPQKLLEELVQSSEAEPSAAAADSAAETGKVAPVPLPSPHLLGMPSEAANGDEPDEPGVTPKRVRQEDGLSAAEREKHRSKGKKQ